MISFLVTGGAGFIGSNLVEKLLEKGYGVRVLDDLSSGKEENIREYLCSIDFVKGDVRDKTVVEKAVKRVDYVVHLAALGSVPGSIEDPVTTHDVNVTGTLNVLNAARSSNVKRVVFASSSSVYGDAPALPKREDMMPAPQSPYAASKIAGEYYCRVFHQVYALETVSLRYFNIYGKRQNPNSQYAAVVPKFITTLLKGERPVIFGNGEQTRDFTFVDDCNQANIKACLAPKGSGGYFNVGYGCKSSLNELYKKVSEYLDSSLKPGYAESRKGDVRDSLADITKAKDQISYEPQFSLDAGIKETVKWYQTRLQKF